MRRVVHEFVAYHKIRGLSWLTEIENKRNLFKLDKLDYGDDSNALPKRMEIWKLKCRCDVVILLKTLTTWKCRPKNPLTVHSLDFVDARRHVNRRNRFWLIDFMFALHSSHFFVSINALFYHRTIGYLDVCFHCGKHRALLDDVPSAFREFIALKMKRLEYTMLLIGEVEDVKHNRRQWDRSSFVMNIRSIGTAKRCGKSPENVCFNVGRKWVVKSRSIGRSWSIKLRTEDFNLNKSRAQFFTHQTWIMMNDAPHSIEIRF